MTAATRPSVSVALCTHNGARFLADQLASILEQDYPVTEIVLSDDASSDESVNIARATVGEYAALHPAGSPQLVVLTNPVALGVAKNFERALAACSGDLVALSDQDDVWRPHRLGFAVERFAADERLLLLSSNARLVDGKGTSLGQSLFVALDLSDEERRALLHHGDAFSALLRRNLVTGATTVLRRSLLAYALPVPAPWIHDEWLAVIAAAVGSVSAVDDQLIDYRQHGTNQIGATKLTLGQKVGRLFEHRGNRYSYLVDRAAVLAERMLSMSDTVGAARIEQAGEKLAHQRVRAGLPAARVRRIAAVLREARTGRYGRFSRGSADVLRDLLQPA